MKTPHPGRRFDLFDAMVGAALDALRVGVPITHELFRSKGYSDRVIQSHGDRAAAKARRIHDAQQKGPQP